MAMRKSFVIKKKILYEKLGDSLSDTQIASRKNEEGDVFNLQQQHSSAQRFATGDGFQRRGLGQEFPKPTTFSAHIKVKDEMKIDLGQSASHSSSHHSDLFKLYPIEEVSERSSLSQASKAFNRPEYIQKILAENRTRAQNRPGSATQRINLERDFEIRKPFLSSEESVMNSTFGDEECKAIAKAHSASKKSISEETFSDSVSSYKHAQIMRLAEDSKRAYRLKIKSDNPSVLTGSSTSFQSLSSKSKSCATCCTKNISNLFRKSKKNA